MDNDKHTSDETELINEIKKITVTPSNSKDDMVHNPTDLPIVNVGKKSAEIRIDATRSATFLKNEASAEEEHQALLMGASLGFTPKVYGIRGTYVVTEFLEAPTLTDHLEHHSLTRELTQKIIQLLEDFQKAGYTRIDHDPASIYVMPDGSLKVANVRSRIKLPPKNFPKKLIRGMGKQVTDFLNLVQELNPAMYQEWSNYHKFERVVQEAILGIQE